MGKPEGDQQEVYAATGVIQQAPDPAGESGT